MYIGALVSSLWIQLEDEVVIGIDGVLQEAQLAGRAKVEPLNCNQ